MTNDGAPLEQFDIARKPSFAAMLMFGCIAAVILGTIDGALFHWIVVGRGSLPSALVRGAYLSFLGAFAIVPLWRILWGNATVGKVLGLVYGLAPGVAVFRHEIVLGLPTPYTITSLTMAGVACTLVGIVVGALYDRVVDAIIVRCVWLQA